MEQVVIQSQYLWLAPALCVAYLGRFLCQRVCGYRNTVRTWVPAGAVVVALALCVSRAIDGRPLVLALLS